MLKLIHRLVNLITYIGAICFFCSMYIIIELGIKIIIKLVPQYFPNAKHLDWTEWMLWGSGLFIIILIQQVIYPIYKKYLYINTK
jgi:hypothetical protein